MLVRVTVFPDYDSRFPGSDKGKVLNVSRIVEKADREFLSLIAGDIAMALKREMDRRRG